jgi:ATP-binding cassette subfamily F protein 3
MRLPFLLALLLLLLPPLSRRAAAFSLVAPPTGQTKGAALLVDKCCIRAGDADLLSDINWSIMPGERWAICGANGTGKTTLLTSIVGGREIAEGQVLVKQGTKLGFLEQKGVAGSVRSVYEEARSQMEATDAGLRLEKIQASLEKDDSPSAEAVEALLRAQATFEAVGGLTQEKDVAEVLSGLGFSAEDRDRSCTEFSGGWQMRIALATVLLSSSTLLVLDEPTNHLDKNAKYWLAGWLKRYDGTIVLVSHDEELLKGLALSGVAETNAGRLDIFKGCSFEMYQKERVLREEMALKRAEAEQREIDRLQGFVDRFGAQATKASAAQSRVKQIEKLEAARAARNDLPDTQASRRATLQLPKPPACGRVQITMKDGAFGHDGVNPIVSDASVTIEKGFRLAILGPNGAGKSTTLSALSGELPLLKGTRNVGEDVVLGVFKQDLAQELPADEVALEHVLKVARQTDMSISDERARGALGALGLTGDKALRKIGMLSGGEKSRVALAIFSLKPANCLLLDEVRTCI